MARLPHVPSLRRKARHAAVAAIAAALPWIPVGCNGDDESLPAYCQELAEMATDADGFATTLATDGGDTLAIANRPGGLSRDSLYRVAALYTRQGNGITLHGLTAILSPVARTYPESAVKTDPVQLDAVWRGGRYLNLRLTLQTGGDAHRMAFIDCGIEQADNGTRTCHIELLHDQNGNPLHFPRETIVSCPLYPYADRLRAGRDSVCIRVQTFNGLAQRTLPF